ncbi:phospholipid-transporting ATPase ID isoform X2 [Nematostella vectensis]|uniref:phospholipid-transporting ATPase ID isoform X2 n=1 Tax=Nematostella vectensis TaxID=45351 RepID=UPI0020772B06|nr:phospholipid-transporting ATPase ID isoform X2 [Nematostella vectensis]
MFKFFRKGRHPDSREADRVIEVNDRDNEAHHHYKDNFIRTSKYTIITFLPKNLFEQFQRVANMYFLLQVIIMSIPEITALKPESTAVPLVFVIGFTAIKDAYDDIRRHQSDRDVNNRKSKALIGNSREEIKWMKIKCGDVLKIDNNEQIPADFLILSTSEENGLCYIETAELDGETNLKCRQPLPDTNEMGDDEALLAKFKATISCEPPNNILDKFNGKIAFDNQEYSLDNDNLILRGCVLRNTDWVYGTVVYAGQDSKLMMNSGVSTFKRTNLDRLLNKLIIGIAVLLACICIVLSIGTTIWEELVGQNFQVFLQWPNFYMNNVVFIGTCHWPSFIMVLNTLIPISLYISVEVIRMGQSIWINWDQYMYYEKKDTPARARTTTLTEELGQIEYIFSDKTGTLTQNVMTFKKCSIHGKMYGKGDPDENVPDSCISELTIPEEDELSPLVDFSSNPYYDGKFRFHDKALIDDIANNSQGCHEMMRLLALCHTVMIDNAEEGLVYQAQSPDEAALVTAARNFGFVFKERSPTTLTIVAMGQEEQHELLAILDFNNDRKRMSVIVRRNDKIKLYCKGADSIIYERLHPSCTSLMDKTTEDLNKFAAEGLRTLVLAYKDITPQDYQAWKSKYDKACVAMDNREEQVQAVYEEIEKNLILIGATAIEDKLQDGVPDAIATLAAANIKIWVLTGDKPETAVNIGYSCQLLTDDMTEVFMINGDSMDAVRESINMYKSKVQAGLDDKAAHNNSVSFRKGSRETAKSDSGVEMISLRDNHVGNGDEGKTDGGNAGFGLVITGKSLVFALNKQLELEFLELACMCKAVICCRVTPLQKALVVQLVKDNKKAVTLAIGDGANDVSMIKAAHIGVGISGQEGMQATLASDYSFAQFRYLERLLLVHGRWSYMRMCKFLNYFFYKNFAFTLIQLWYAFFTGYSAQTLYDAWFISFYNVLFTSGPVVFLAIFDQDVNHENCIRYPKLYVPGQQNIMFNKRVFAYSLFYGSLTSLWLYFLAYGVLGFVTIDSVGRDTSNLKFFGTAVAATLVVVVNVEISLKTQYWTWINHFFTWGSIIFYFIFYFIYYSQFFFNRGPQEHYFGVQFQVFGNPVFWLYLLIAAFVTNIPSICEKLIRSEYKPTLSDAVRRKQQGRERTVLKLREFRPRLTRRRSSKRTSYAFSHQEGFGSIVMSPASFLRRKLNVRGNQRGGGVRGVPV